MVLFIAQEGRMNHIESVALHICVEKALMSTYFYRPELLTHSTTEVTQPRTNTPGKITVNSFMKPWPDFSLG